MSAETKSPFLPKSEWGPGPWENEPDREVFTHAGQKCLLRRTWHGIWCGYVLLAPGHPALSGNLNRFDVHGGVTWRDEVERGFCLEGLEGLMGLGFDCGHWGDIMPGLEAELRRSSTRGYTGNGLGYTYRTIDYARAQLKALAEQVRAEEAKLEARREGE